MRPSLLSFCVQKKTICLLLNIPGDNPLTLWYYLSVEVNDWGILAAIPSNGGHPKISGFTRRQVVMAKQNSNRLVRAPQKVFIFTLISTVTDLRMCIIV